MRFYLALMLVDVACFLPLYLLHLRTHPNPFHAIVKAEKSRWIWILERLYMRERSPDPFRIQFDFTFFVLVAVGLGATGPVARAVATFLLAFGFVEIVYTSVMHAIFRRAPALRSDLSLLRTGIKLARRQMVWMLPLAAVALVAVWSASVAAASMLFDTDPPARWSALAAAGLLLPPCFYHCTTYRGHPWRMVHSPILHLLLNVHVEGLLRRWAHREAEYFHRLNAFRDVTLADAPNVVVVCVESYGSVVYRDPRHGADVGALLRRHADALEGAGYHFASTFSEAPLFAGGSWLSLATFAYGVRIDSIGLYDVLFAPGSNFAEYESLFDVLRRNGYDNVLLCPLGGTEPGAVDWGEVDRCFRPQLRIAYDDLRYRGPTVNFFGAVRLHAALDQYALGFGYERARERGRPFSLFFCTLNSHYPWHAAPEAVDDWRALDAPVPLEQIADRPPIERYNAAIRYQLDYVLRFAAERAEESPLIVLFGDHQPPMITPGSMGKETPIHILSRDRSLIDAFLEHGFVPTLDLTDQRPRGIRHEAALSLLMRAMQAAYGVDRQLDVPYREWGAPLFDREAVGVR